MSYDVLVIGGGPAGLSASINVRARGRSALVVSNPLEENPLWRAEKVDNYLGLPGLDVVSTEPIRGDTPLLTAKNCILPPQISWAPRESRQRIMACTVDNVRAYLQGAPINVVNP